MNSTINDNISFINELASLEEAVQSIVKSFFNQTKIDMQIQNDNAFVAVSITHRNECKNQLQELITTTLANLGE